MTGGCRSGNSNIPLNPTVTVVPPQALTTMSSRSVRLRDYSTSPSLTTKATIPEEEEPLAPHSEDATDDGEDTLQEGHGVSVIPNDTAQLEWDDGIPVSGSWRSFLIRALALLCAMSLSIGSHLLVPHSIIHIIK